jgi:hypothetical protein
MRSKLFTIAACCYMHCFNHNHPWQVVPLQHPVLLQEPPRGMHVGTGWHVFGSNHNNEFPTHVEPAQQPFVFEVQSCHDEMQLGLGILTGGAATGDFGTTYGDGAMGGGAVGTTYGDGAERTGATGGSGAGGGVGRDVGATGADGGPIRLVVRGQTALVHAIRLYPLVNIRSYAALNSL